jgi:hypothetical protein
MLEKKPDRRQEGKTEISCDDGQQMEMAQDHVPS